MVAVFTTKTPGFNMLKNVFSLRSNQLALQSPVLPFFTFLYCALD